MRKLLPLGDLEPGMILDEAIVALDGSTVMEEGTVLTRFFIGMLQDPSFYREFMPKDAKAGDMKLSIYIPEEESEEPTALAEGVPSASNKEALLDPDYVTAYMEVLIELRALLDRTTIRHGIDLDAIGFLIAEKQLDRLCDGAHAITQIHNMDRDSEDYLVQHSLHVAVLAGLMGRWLGWEREKRERLILAGVLIDVGKLKVPSSILNKPGKLTPDERKVIENHPVYGHEILTMSGMKTEQEILLAVLQHHERCDGSGYPGHLKKAMISPMGRILGILDIYDAMAANRSYARKISPFEIFDVLTADMMDGKLDAEYGVLFVKKVCAALIGNWVRLTNDEKAKIVYIDQSRTSSLPIVETEAGRFYDLATESRVKIDSLLTYREAVDAKG